MEYNDFDHESVPYTWNSVHSTSDPFNPYGGHYPPALEDQTRTKPFSYPYYSHQAMLPSTASPYGGFQPSHASGVCTVEQTASVTSPASALGYMPTSFAFADHSHSQSPTDPITTKFVPYYAAKAHPKKRPRGTTGSVVCNNCGYKFTVVSSLNRHRKICRGKRLTEKPAKKSSSTQPKSIETKAVGSMSDYNVDALHASQENPAHDADIHAISTSSSTTGLLGSGNANLVSDFTLPESHFQKPASD